MKYSANVALFLTLFRSYCSEPLVVLNLLKLHGKISSPIGEFPCALLSKGKLEVIEEKMSNEVVLCDIFPIPLLNDDAFRPKGSLVEICNRDDGIFDNLPYDWVGNSSKKRLFDLCSFDLQKKVFTKQLPSVEAAFCGAIESVLNAKIINLVVEISDEVAKDQIKLGGAVMIAMHGDCQNWKKVNSTELLPQSLSNDANPSTARLINCHMDELVAFALSMQMPILVSKRLFEKGSMDAILRKSPTNDALEIHANFRNQGCKAEMDGSDLDRITAAWEIFDPRRFLAMSTIQKRATLRASGISNLPRPREGVSVLDNLLADVMDDAVRAEYFRLIATQGPAARTGQQGNSNDDDVAIRTNSRQDLLRRMSEALSEGDIKLAESLREQFVLASVTIADPTQPRGSYDRYLDQDDWYMEARRKAMAPKPKKSLS